MLILGMKDVCQLQRFTVESLVLLNQEIHGKMDASKFTSQNRQVTRITGACTKTNGIEPSLQIMIGDVFPHPDPHFKINTLFLHQANPTFNYGLLQLKLWNSISKDTSGTGGAIVYHHVISSPV
jgi:hypothetical protein